MVWSSDTIQAFHAKRIEKVVEIRDMYNSKLIYAEYWPNYITDEKIEEQVALEKCPRKKKMLKKVAVKFNWILKRDSIAGLIPRMPEEPGEDASAHDRIQYRLAKQDFDSVKGSIPHFEKGPFYLANNVCLKGGRSDCMVERKALLDPMQPVRQPRARLDKTIVKLMREDFKQIQ